MGIRVRKGEEKDQFFNTTAQMNDLAIVERAIDRPTNTTVFFLAGLGVNGTSGAVYYVVNHWNDLWKKYHDKPFALCLGFKNVLDDPKAYMRPTILFETAGNTR